MSSTRFVYLSMDIWIVPTFQLLGVMLLWTQLYECLSKSLDICLYRDFPTEMRFCWQHPFTLSRWRSLACSRTRCRQCWKLLPQKRIPNGSWSVCSVLGRTAVRGSHFPRLQITYRVSSFTLGSEHTNLWRDPRPILFSWIELAPHQGDKHVYKQNKSWAGQCQTSLSWPKIQVEH